MYMLSCAIEILNIIIIIISSSIIYFNRCLDEHTGVYQYNQSVKF